MGYWYKPKYLICKNYSVVTQEVNFFLKKYSILPIIYNKKKT